MNNLKIGLLPLYIELYNKTLAEILPKAEGFVKTIIVELKNLNNDIYNSPIFCIKKDFVYPKNSNSRFFI